MSTDNQSINNITEQQKPKKNLFKRIFKFLLLFFLFSTIFVTVASLVISEVYKKEIKTFVITKVEEAIQADIGVGKIQLSIIDKFPKVSLSFSNFDVVSSFQNKIDTLVIGRKLFFEFDILDVLKHNYKVTSLSFEDAAINFKINKQGRANFDIFKPTSSSDSSSSFLLSLNNFQFKNIDISYQDDKQHIYLKTSLKKARFKGDFNNDEFAVEVYNDFILHKFTSDEFTLKDKNIIYDGVLNFDKINKVFHLTNNQLTISELKILVNGDIDYSYQDKINLNISCSSNNINISSLATINQVFYVKFIEEYKPKGKLDIDASLIGFASKSELPSLNLGFSIYDADFELFDMSFHKLKMKGILQLDENIKQVKVLSSQMKFDNDDVILNGLFSFKNLQQLKFDIKTNLSSKSFSSVLNNVISDSLNFNFDGNTLIDVQADLNILNNNVEFTSINGGLLLEKGVFKFDENNEEFYIDTLSTNFIEDGKLILSLSALYKNERLLSSFEIFNFKDYINKKSNAISSKAQISLNKYVIPQSSNHNDSTGHRVILPDFIYSNVDIHINELVYLSASILDFNLLAKVSPNRVEVNHYQFNIFDGEVKGNAKVNQSSSTIHTEALGLNFQTLFKTFNNFDQNNIKSDHITGFCDLIIDTKAPLNAFSNNDDLIVVGEFKIKEGQLVNVPIVNDIVNYLDNNLVTKSVLDMKRLRSVSKNISFNEIKNSFTIKNGELIIPDFTIKSSVLDVNLDGYQKLSGYFRYNMNFRLAEIVSDSQDDNVEFGIVEDDGTGMRIFMKIFGTSDDVRFEIDKEAKKEFSKENNKSEKKELMNIIKSELPFLKKNKDKVRVERSSSDSVEFQLEEEEEDKNTNKDNNSLKLKEEGEIIQFEIEE